jgi:hypothetical protein
MKKLLVELARIRAAKNRAESLISSATGSYCIVTVHTCIQDMRPRVSVFKSNDEAGINALAFELENSVFLHDLTQSDAQVIDSGLSGYIVDICEILTNEFGGE